METKYLSRRETAARLGISISTLSRLINRGVFGSAVVKLGRRILFHVDVIENLADYSQPMLQKEKKNA